MEQEQMLSYGIDCAKGLKSCMGDPDFYRKILGMFQQDTCFARARAAYGKRDYKQLFACMHELKGESGNIAFTGLYEASSALVELLRNGTTDDAQVDKLFAAVDAAYARACEGIALFLA